MISPAQVVRTVSKACPGVTIVRELLLTWSGFPLYIMQTKHNHLIQKGEEEYNSPYQKKAKFIDPPGLMRMNDNIKKYPG